VYGNLSYGRIAPLVLPAALLPRRTRLVMFDIATVAALDRTGYGDYTSLSDSSTDRSILALEATPHVDVYCVRIPPLLIYVKIKVL